jgi:RHS repeat-associated protein
MGAMPVAKRVTGTYMNEPYDRTDWLHRNHLQEVVGADYSNLVGGTPGWSWKHPRPFSSGGSDQFTGHKHDSETGLKYFGARYYHEAAARWTSPDAVLYHRYDPQSVNKYAYVRNDPVNKVDLDGRSWDCSGPYEDTSCRWEDDRIMLGAPWLPQQLSPEDPVPGDAGGGGGDPDPGVGSGFIRVKNPSKSGANQDRIRAVLSWIKANADKDCTDWLIGLGDAIDSILGDPADERTVLIGHGEFDDSSIGAFTGNDRSQTDIPDGFAMTVNDTGLFFKSISGLTAGGYSGGSSQAQVFILLHELGHWLNAAGYQSDFGVPDAGRANDNLVKNNCGKTINGAEKIP